MTDRIITHHVTPYLAVQDTESNIEAIKAKLAADHISPVPHPMASFEDTTHAYECGYRDGIKAAQLRAPATRAQPRDFTREARSWPTLTQKYLRRWPESKKTQHWRGKAVHIETENGVWRKGGHGYTYAGAPDAGLWIFEDAMKQIDHCGPEKRGAFILVPVEALTALEGGDA